MLGYINEKLSTSIIAEVRSGYERTLHAIEVHVRDLKLELENERLAHAETRQLLQRALRLEPRHEVQTGEAKPHLESIGRTKSWPKLQQELEQKHRRKPEDETAKYWAEKQAAMAQESTILDAAIAADITELEKI